MPKTRRTFEAAGCVPIIISQPQKQDHTLQGVDLERTEKVARVNPIFRSVEPCDLLDTRSSLH